MILLKERLRLSNITKTINENVILNHISLTIYEGESVGLYYTRYRPKDTLLHLISGEIPFDSGFTYWNETLINGNLIQEKQSIFVLNTTCTLIEELSIEENLFVVRKHRRRMFFPNWKTIRLQSVQHLQEIGLGHLTPSMKVSDLTSGEKKILELLRAKLYGACLFIVNDVISTLDRSDYNLFKTTLRYFQNFGISILIADSHFSYLESFTDRIVFLDHAQLLSFPQKNIKQFLSLHQIPGNTVHANVQSTFTFKNRFDKYDYKLPFSLSGGQLIEICCPHAQAFDLYQKLLDANPNLYQLEQNTGIFNMTQPLSQFITFDTNAQLFDFLSPIENLIFPYYPRLSKGIVLSPRKINIIVRDFIEWYGTDIFLHKKKLSDLSLHEKLGILIYRYRLSGIKVLFCVDPRNGFDIKIHSHILDLLRRLTQCCKIDICILTSDTHEHIPNCNHLINMDVLVQKPDYS